MVVTGGGGDAGFPQSSGLGERRGRVGVGPAFAFEDDGFLVRGYGRAGHGDGTDGEHHGEGKGDVVGDLLLLGGSGGEAFACGALEGDIAGGEVACAGEGKAWLAVAGGDGGDFEVFVFAGEERRGAVLIRSANAGGGGLGVDELGLADGGVLAEVPVDVDDEAVGDVDLAGGVLFIHGDPILEDAFDVVADVFDVVPLLDGGHVDLGLLGEGGEGQEARQDGEAHEGL